MTVLPSLKGPRMAGLRRGAYLLPSLFTIGNILLGFYAIICGLEGKYDKAALLVFVAGIIDALDGRIARLTGTESEFGKEFDSLADVITFGVSPALLTYLWGVQDVFDDAWVLSLFYVVCMATRLARFNVQTKTVDNRFFVGLPAPAAAGAICSLLFFAYFADEYRLEWQAPLRFVVAGSLVLIGLLMVSTFRYVSFKKLPLRRRMSYRFAIPLAAVIFTIYRLPQATFLVIALLYTASAPVAWLYGRLRPRPPAPPAPPEGGESAGAAAEAPLAPKEP